MTDPRLLPTDPTDPTDHALLTVAGAHDPDEFDRSRARSRHLTAFALDDAVADEAMRQRTVRRRLRLPALGGVPAFSVAGGLAAAVLVAGALSPWDGDGGGPAGLIASDASAAEVLEAAAERLDARPVPSGGGTWHAVSTGSNGSVSESWYDAVGGVSRWATYGGADATYDLDPTYYVLDATRDSLRIRQYVLRDGTWEAMSAAHQIDEAGTYPGMSAEVETLRWLATVERAADPAQLRAANERFLEQTRMTFTPPAAPGSDAVANARALQVLYLLRVAQVRPDASAQLYRDVLDLETLERLPGRTLDGRPVIRLQLFEPPSLDQGGDTLENVLLLDPETGVPLGTENRSGDRRTRFEQPARVAEVGAAARTCGSAALPPCSLLEGTGPVAALAARRSMRAGAGPLG